MTEREIARVLRELETPALHRLRDLIDVLLAEVEESTSEDQDQRDPGGEVALERRRGWVELKMINGHGPYAYLRWREGRVKRSRYLGKAAGLDRAEWAIQQSLPILEDRIYTCQLCGTSYTPVIAHQKYCSRECGEIADWLRRGHDRFVIFERDGFRCVYCGRSAMHGAALEIDHVCPRDAGGEDIAENLVTACHRCNVAKTNTPLRNPSEMFDEISKRNETIGLGPRTEIRL